MSFLPPTVAPPPPRRRRSDPKAVVVGVVVLVAVLGGAFLVARYGIDKVRHRDDAPKATTTTAPADAGLVASVAADPREPVVLLEVADPLRGKAEVGGLRARLISEDVSDASWSYGVGVGGGGRSATRTGAEEFLLAPDQPIASPDLEQLAVTFVGAQDAESSEHHATTVLGFPAHFATSETSSVSGPIRSYALTIDVGDTVVIATLDGTNIDADSLAREWARFVASIEPV